VAAPFVLFTPGGGGYRIEGQPVSELFLDAAERLHAATGIECLTLQGALHGGAPERAAPPKTLTLPQVPQPLLRDLLRRAQLVVTNGGNTLTQALSAGAACVAAPLGGDDQPGRIGAYTKAGLLLAAAAQAGALAEAAQALVVEPQRRETLRRQVAATPVVNGIPLMLRGIEELLPAP